MAYFQYIVYGVTLMFCLSEAARSDRGKQAIAVINSTVVHGVIRFSQDNVTAPVIITGTIEGLAKGNHGFHIHEKGDVSGGCGTTGSHYNPHSLPHGGPTDLERHIGDLGNIFAEADGKALVNIIDPKISLSGKYSVVGRAVVVHADADDLGRKGFSDSRTTGHAGNRVGCAVIGIEHPPNFWNGSSTVSSSIVLLLSASFILSLLNLL